MVPGVLDFLVNFITMGYLFYWSLFVKTTEHTEKQLKHYIKFMKRNKISDRSSCQITFLQVQLGSPRHLNDYKRFYYMIGKQTVRL